MNSNKPTSNKRNKHSAPLPLYDALEHIEKNFENVSLQIEKYKNTNNDINIEDFKITLKFLNSYIGSKGTFNSYRRDIERLLHWAWNIEKKSLKELKREDIETFIKFCQNPLKNWIGTTKAPKFIAATNNDIKKNNSISRIPNAKWKPFVVTVSKSEHKKGKRPNVKNFALSNGAIKELFAILSSFYNFLLQEEYVKANVVALIRQKSKFIRKQQESNKIRRLSELQWKYVIKTATLMANENPDLHERTLFIMSALYLMYLRISELAANERWCPSMNDFFQTYDGNWWFLTVGKGNKERQIAVSDTMLNALKRWRKFLGASTLPTAADSSPLLPKLKGKGAITSTTYLREVVQNCFNKSIDNLNKDGYTEDAESLMEATVHWLRHTGISDDIKTRPRDHVRIDAGHSSSMTTDKYIDIELKERHASAKGKQIVEEKE